MTNEITPPAVEQASIPANPETPLRAPAVEAATESAADAEARRQAAEERRQELQLALTALSASDDLHQQTQQHAQQLKALPTAQQLTILATLAFEKGTWFAVRTAEHLGDLALLDQLHDYLVRDDVYPHLDIIKRNH